MDDYDDDFPCNGDHYYWIRSDTGDICESRWIDGRRTCEFRKSIGNVFESYSAAQEALAKWQHEVERRRKALK